MGRKVIDQAHGKTGRVFVNGNEICVTSWNITVTMEEEETTNSCSAGNNEYEYGAEVASGTVEAQWDITVNPFDDPPYIHNGITVTLKLYVHSAAGVGLADGPFWLIIAKINGIKNGVTAKQKVMYSFDYKSSGAGAITYPTAGESAS